MNELFFLCTSFSIIFYGEPFLFLSSIESGIYCPDRVVKNIASYFFTKGLPMTSILC